jgi:hypothetical protein
VPKDDLRLPRLPPAALSPEMQALLKSQQSALEQLWPPALKDQLAGLGTLLPPPRWPRSVIALKQRQLVDRLQAIEALERERDAIERKIASERKAARAIEAELARASWTPTQDGATSPPAKTPAPAPVVSAAPEPDLIDPPAPGKEERDGPQAELTRLFFQEAYAGHPPKKIGCRPLRERMENWVAEKNKLDHGSRIAASETTIRRVRGSL